MADTLEEAFNNAFNQVCNVFGFDSLNTHQEESIKYIVQEKKDIFVNLPTGFGKSLIYHALPLVYSCLQSTDENNIIVVISPLNSLIKDQVFRQLPSNMVTCDAFSVINSWAVDISFFRSKTP